MRRFVAVLVAAPLAGLTAVALAGCSVPSGSSGAAASHASPSSSPAPVGVPAGTMRGWPEGKADCHAIAPDLFDPARAAAPVPGLVTQVVVCPDLWPRTSPMMPVVRPVPTTSPVDLFAPVAVVTSEDGVRFDALVVALSQRSGPTSGWVCATVAYPRAPHPVVYVRVDSGRSYRVDVPTPPCTQNYTDAVYLALAAVGAVPPGTRTRGGSSLTITTPTPSHAG